MKKRETYDRAVVGTRLKERRKQLGWSRKYVAEKIGLVERYYSDIERGTCGMSVETLMALTKLYGFSMDALIYGEDSQFGTKQDEELMDSLEKMPEYTRNCCRQMILMFIKGIEAGDKKSR